MHHYEVPQFVTVPLNALESLIDYNYSYEAEDYIEQRLDSAPPNDPSHVFSSIVTLVNVIDNVNHTPDQAMYACFACTRDMPEDFDADAPPAPPILPPVKSKAVKVITVTDPDTGLPCDLEIRKLATGELVGVDAAYTERLVDEIGFNNPYAPGEVEIPSDETL